MSPDGYRQLLEHVKATGVNVWVQDGSGVDKLTAEQRERYLQASADCQSSAPASGIVYELFVAGKGKTFTAKPKPDAEIASLLAKRSSCGKDTLCFSLRYLPSRTAFSSIKSPPGKSGTTWLTSFALVRIPSRLIAKKRAKERKIVIGERADHSCRKLDPLSGVSDI